MCRPAASSVGARPGRPQRRVATLLLPRPVWLADAGSLADLTAASPAPLILLDTDLPGVDGAGFVRQVRANPGYSTVRIVIMATAPHIRRLADTLDDGAAEYLTKPVSAPTLLQRLQAIPE